MPPPDAPTPGEPGASGPEAGEAAETQDAASAALARARGVARGKGLRPGSRPARRRVADVPVDKRSTADRDFTTLGAEMEHFVAERGWGIDIAAGSVMGRWPQIVGPEVAPHCEPASFELGVLTIRAESTAWATQLRLLESTLLARIATEVGEGVVASVVVVGPSAPRWSKGPRQVSDGRGPRDTYG